MSLKRTFCNILAVTGMLGIVWGAYSFLVIRDTEAGYYAAIPFFMGLLFLFIGISLKKHDSDHF